MPQDRDAIHIAVAPVVASVRLSPGAFIDLDPMGMAFKCKEDSPLPGTKEFLDGEALGEIVREAQARGIR